MLRTLSGTQPSSCSFWRLAASGQVFYTVPSDHYNCPVGSYTHNIALPKDREPELMNTLTLMVNVGYSEDGRGPEHAAARARRRR